MSRLPFGCRRDPAWHRRPGGRTGQAVMLRWRVSCGVVGWRGWQVQKLAAPQRAAGGVSQPERRVARRMRRSLASGHASVVHAPARAAWCVLPAEAPASGVIELRAPGLLRRMAECCGGAGTTRGWGCVRQWYGRLVQSRRVQLIPRTQQMAYNWQRQGKSARRGGGMGLWAAWGLAPI